MTHIAYICASQDGCGFVSIIEPYKTCPTCTGPMIESFPLNQDELAAKVTESVQKLKSWLLRNPDFNPWTPQ
jgi:hypothetical protein